MTKLEKSGIPIIFAVAVFAYAMSWVMSNEAFSLHWVVREDGLLEWLTALSLLSGAILCWWRCWTLRQTHSKLFIRCSAFYGCVLFFGMGEELSWGQRMLGIETPETLAEINLQNETNLHNLVIGGVNINKLIFGKLLAAGLACYLLVLPMLFVRRSSMQRLFNRFAVPIPRVQHSLAILATVMLVETSRATKRGEINEFAITSLVLLLLLNPLNRQIFGKPALSLQHREYSETPVRKAA